MSVKVRPCSANALVGDNNEQVTELLEMPTYFKDAGHEFDVFRPESIACVGIDDAIAVKEKASGHGY